MRPRTLGKIVIAVLLVVALLAGLIYAMQTPDNVVHDSARAIAYAIMALTFATVYRYFED